MNKSLFILPVIFILFSCSGDDDKFTPKASDALYDSRSFIEPELYSPASAEFNTSTDGVKQINDSTFYVSSYVDADNKFGAKLRINYTCTLTYLISINKVNCDGLKLTE
jgi:uncharacterized protein YyaL (SSP411 family)